MINYVKKIINNNNLEGKTILVGLSGGADSSALCDILSKIKKIRLIAIHLNHNWRGLESKRDEEFCRNFAKERNIEFFTETLSADCQKTETAARELRYAFFEKCKEKFNAQAVFLAHNKNDNVETLIYRLIKGTGARGLISIPPKRDFYIRPLIGFKRAEIEKYLKENNIEYIEDSSNSDTKYKRNLIRKEIIPLMETINPKLLDSISSFIEVNKMNQKIVDDAVSKAFCKIKNKNAILRDKFLTLETELQYEIINRFIQGIVKNRDFKTVEKIVDFIKNNDSSKISLKKDLFLKIYNNNIYLNEEKEEKYSENLLNEGENKFLNYTIFIEKATTPEVFPDNLSNVQFLNLDFKKQYTLRNRKKGDKIQPFGQKSYEKLKDFLIKKKIPSEKRGEIPMIAINDEILFIPNVMTSEKLKVDKNQKTCYKLTITKKDL